VTPSLGRSRAKTHQVLFFLPWGGQLAKGPPPFWLSHPSSFFIFLFFSTIFKKKLNILLFLNKIFN
jgi:hypothetical protein